MFRSEEMSVWLLRFTAVSALMVPVLISPWLFASVQPWAQLASLVFVSLACVITIVLSLMHEPTSALPTLVWAAIALVILGFIQLFPFGGELVEQASPRSVEIRDSFGQGTAIESAFSLNPARTRLTIGLLCLCTMVFLLTYRLLDGHLMERLMLLVAINGACLTAYAFFLRQTGDGRVYGMVQTVGTAMGPFVNRNNAAGFLLASAAAALLVVGLNFYRLRHDFQPSYSALFAPAENPRGMIALVCFVFITYGIVMTESRGGLLGLVVGLLGALAISLRREFFKLAVVAVSVLVAVVLAAVSTFGHWDSTSVRAATVLDERELAADGRLSVWSGCVDLVNDFWITGCGLGAFRDVFRLYDKHANGTLATYAENTWIEMACSGGVVGLGLLVLMLILLVAAVYRLLVHQDGDVRVIGGIGVFFVLSQFVASQFDFGLSIPANQIQFSFFAAALVVASTHAFSGEEASSHRGHRNPIGRWLSGRQFEIVLVGLLGLATLVGIDLIRASSVETIQAFEGGSKKVNLASEQQHARLERAIFQRWDDADAQYALAESYIQQYESLLAENAQELGLPIQSVAELRPVLIRLRSDDRFLPAFENLANAEPTVQYLLPALKHLKAARDANCLIPNVHLRLHHLSALDLNQEVDAIHLSRAIWLWEGRRHDYFVDGLSHYRMEDYAQAFRSWRPCLLEASRYRSQIVALAIRVAEPETLLKQLFPSNKKFLSELISRDLANPGQEEYRNKMIKIYDARFGAKSTR